MSERHPRCQLLTVDRRTSASIAETTGKGLILSLRRNRKTTAAASATPCPEWLERC